MIGDLSTTIGINYRYILWILKRFKLATDASGKNRRVLQKPDLIRGTVVALITKPAHLRHTFGVVNNAFLANQNSHPTYSATSTLGSLVRSI